MAENELTIELVREDEIEQAYALYTKITRYLESHINYPEWTVDEWPSLEYVIKDQAADTLYVVRDDTGAMVAITTLNDDPDAPYEGDFWTQDLARGEYMVLHRLGVDPDYCGQGVGRALVNFCIDTAKKRGYKGLRLDVYPGNVPAEKLYESCGFRLAGMKDIGYYEDREFPVEMYELDF